MSTVAKFVMLCAALATLSMVAPAAANPVCLEAADVTDAEAYAEGLAICEVHVQLSNYTDRVLNVGQSDIVTDDPDGFVDYEVSIGADPSGAAIDPTWDSTINGRVIGGWFSDDPASDEGYPDSELKVQVGSFIVHAGYNVSGTMTLYSNAGSATTMSFTCFAPPQCGVDADCDDGDDGTDDLCLGCGCVNLAPAARGALSMSGQQCQADFDGSDWVDAADLAFLLGAWGSNPEHIADLNCDDIVDETDREFLLDAWGPAGVIVGLDKNSQGVQCAAEFRPCLAPFVLSARTKVDPGDPTNPDAEGEAGAVRIDKDGTGVARANCGGDKQIAGKKNDQNEELIITFDDPVAWDSIVLGLNKIKFNKAEPVIFVTVPGVGTPYIILEPDILTAFTPTGGDKGEVDFSGFAPSAGLLVKSFKIRATKHLFYVKNIVHGCPDD